MAIYIKGTDVCLQGTLERIVGVAHVTGIDEEGDPIYGGETLVDWNSQTTATTADDLIIWVNEDGNYHSGVEIEERVE